MALGSSAPEILLSIIEVAGNNFHSGALGPNTIVGSAAFNLFMIIAICVWSVPSDEHRRQNHIYVFFVTCTWSIWAYIWLYIILSVSSPGKIDIWEGVLTFIFFPITVLTAYIADQKIIVTKFLSKRYRSTSKGVISATEGADVELHAADGVKGYFPVPQEEWKDPAVRAFEEHRKEFIELMKELRRKNPNTDPETLQQMAEVEMINRGPKSRAFYRVQATRKLTGGGNVVKRKIEKEHNKSMDPLETGEDEKLKKTCRVSFTPAHYTVLENVGTFDVIVGREGGPPNLTIMVDYESQDGTADAGADYVGVKGTLTLHPEDTQATISIQIIDDDVFEEDEHFYIHLSNLRVQTKDGLVIDPNALGGVPVAELDMPLATVMILDDDHAGVFGFEHTEYDIVESAGKIHLKVMRSSGARGKVLIPYRSLNGTALADKDFEPVEGELVFDNDEVEKFIEIGIVDHEEYERSEVFYVELDDPIWAKKLSDQNKVIERYLRRMEKKRKSQDRRGSKGGIQNFLSRFGGKEEHVGDEKSVDSAEDDLKSQNDELTDETIAEMGKPKLGETTKVAIQIKESKELKGVVDKMLKTANTSLVLGTSSWREQFVEALTVSAGDEDEEGEEEGEEKGGEGEEEGPGSGPSWGDYVMHFISVPWKLLFAFIPPTDYWGGWACFIVSIMGIGLCTALVGDIASHFGCTIGLKDAVVAISFVALGTSVPDTFASKVAAIQDKYADSSIGNVTGSNGVNVFLGIGIAWTLAAVVRTTRGEEFNVCPGTLAFSVSIFCGEALICITILMLRRLKPVGGELGGPMIYKLPTTIILACLWFTYVILSSLESYDVIQGF